MLALSRDQWWQTSCPNLAWNGLQKVTTYALRSDLHALTSHLSTDQIIWQISVPVNLVAVERGGRGRKFLNLGYIAQHKCRGQLFNFITPLSFFSIFWFMNIPSDDCNPPRQINTQFMLHPLICSGLNDGSFSRHASLPGS